MYFTRFCVCYALIIVVVIEAEIFTLTKNKDVRCVATDADINSTIYLHPPTNSALKYENEFECKNDSKQEPYVQMLPNQHEHSFAVCIRDNDWKETKKYMGIISDQRWEGLPIYENPLNFTDLEPETKYGFSVCSEQNNFTIREVIKCHNKKKCNTKSDAKKFQKNEASTDICKIWYHYNLEKHGTDQLSNFSITNESMKIITSYSTATQDNDLQISTKSTSFWKLHKMNFKEATQATKKESSILILHSGPLYVSMLVYLNSKSNLQLNLTSNNVIILKNIEGKNCSKAWQKIELNITSVNQTTLYIRRNLAKHKTDGYWAIDEIKFYTRKMRVYRAKLAQENPLHTCKSLTTVAYKLNKDFLPRKFENPCKIHCDHIFGKDPFCENYTSYSHDTNKSMICKDTSNSPDKIPVLFAELSLQDISDDSITIQVINLTYDSDQISEHQYAIHYKKIPEKNFTKLDNLTFSTLDEIRNKTFVIGNLSTKEFQYRVEILLIFKNQSSIKGKPELTTYRRSLHTTSRTSNNFTIEWSHPENKSSPMYIVKYQCKQKFCNQQSATVTEKTKNLFFKFDLKPLTKCCVKLYILQNNKQEQLFDKIELTTQGTNTIEDEEMPYNFTVSKNFITTTFQDCEKFSGPIKYNFEFRCISAWCINNYTNVPFNMDSYKPTIKFDTKLSPFTSYNATVTAIRSNATEFRVYTLEKTPPGKPKKVGNLSVDCWGSTSLRIKWQPPYPPTGEISHYVVTYQESKASIASTINETYTCKTDDDFICVNISKLEREIYNITVQAKNTNFDKPGMPETISSSSVSNARKIFKNFKFTPLPPNEISLIWENMYLKHLYIKEQYSNVITKNCQQSCEHRINIKDETNYTIGVWSSYCSSEKTLIKMEVTSFPQLSTNPLIKLCLEANCSLWIPKPNTTANTSNFSISVRKTDDEKSGWDINPLTLHENNYFQVEIGDSPGRAVFLHNKSYVMYLQDNSNNQTYSLFDPITLAYDWKIRLSAFVCLITLLILTIIFLGYLLYAYQYKIYPFDIVPNVPIPKSPKNLSQAQADVMQFSEHYKLNRIKTIRHKVDPPSNEAELKLLIEPGSSKQDKNSLSTTPLPIQVENFEDYLMRSLGDDPYNNDLTKQYKKLQAKTVKPCKIGLLNKNVDKNRYKNLAAYDDTRVILKDNDNCDYINANFIDGYQNTKAFIATQAPLQWTLGDFWWMIWQEKVSHIIMLTELVENGTVKCEKYWPELLQKARFGKIVIENVREKRFSDYIHRQFRIQCENENRTISHLQYTTWPDHGEPLYPQNFTPFVKRLLAMSQQKAPVVVHCNAGCGRTGTLILCDIVLRMAAKEKTIDFVRILKTMREQRVGLVNNVKQYVFAHFVVLECLFGVDFSIPINSSFQDEVWKVLRKTTIKPLMDELDKVMTQFKKRHASFASNISDDDKRKNRFSDIFPGHTQIYLSTSSQNPSNYINAVTVDCYRCPKKFIVTQQPLPNTVEDFWKLIKEFEVNTIVSLNEIDGNDPTCPQFWSCSNNTTKLQIMDEVEDRLYTNTKIKITDETEKNSEKTVNVLKMKRWKKETMYPANPKDLIIIWKEMFNSSWKGASQIVVTCYDGATASGLFVALAHLLEKINYEQLCDVFSAIRTVRHSREQFVQEWGQMEFLYKAAKIYIEEFDNYDNFDN